MRMVVATASFAKGALNGAYVSIISTLLACVGVLYSFRMSYACIHQHKKVQFFVSPPPPVILIQLLQYMVMLNLFPAVTQIETQFGGTTVTLSCHLVAHQASGD